MALKKLMGARGVKRRPHIHREESGTVTASHSNSLEQACTRNAHLIKQKEKKTLKNQPQPQKSDMGISLYREDGVADLTMNIAELLGGRGGMVVVMAVLRSKCGGRRRRGHSEDEAGFIQKESFWLNFFLFFIVSK